MSIRTIAWTTKGRAALAWTTRNVSLRDVTIMLALVLLWRGLAAIYQPLAPVAIGTFLLWYTTIRRIPQ